MNGNFKKRNKSLFLQHSFDHISLAKRHGHERLKHFLRLTEAYLWPKDEVESFESVGVVPLLAIKL
jgi:hypothetical protein